MKVLGIISSSSKEKNTAKLVLKAIEGARKCGAETEIIFLNQHSLKFCTGCMTCLKMGHCILDDDLETLRQKIYDADGIILGSPTHALGPNALMKNFLDRIGLYSVYSGAISNKYVAGIATAGRMGAKTAAKQLTHLGDSFFSRCYISGTLGSSVGWDSIDKFPSELNKAFRLGEKMATDIQNKNTYPFQKLFDRILKACVLKNIMTSNILAQKETTMKAVYQYHLSKGWIKN